jgi:hypothetical protein
MSTALNKSTPASPAWARLGIGSSRSNRTTARVMGTTANPTFTAITLGRVSDTRAATQSVRYRERLRVPWWFWPPGLGLAALVATEVDMGVAALPGWVPFAVLLPIAAAALMWLGRMEIRVEHGPGGVELWAGRAHLPVEVITRQAEVPRSAKSAALGRQLDPAAYVMHRAWIGPMVLVVLDDPDDPSPYWLLSSRHPDRVLAALRN